LGRLTRWLRPGNRPIARHPLVLVDIGFDQARINRKGFATNQPSRNAFCHYGLKYAAQRIALTKALVPSTTEYRVIRDAILNAEL
jgi:hypothetical protein